MSAATAWFVSIVSFLGLLLALHQLGVNEWTSLGSLFWNVAHALGQPLSAGA